jgi:hypothetical protein
MVKPNPLGSELDDRLDLAQFAVFWPQAGEERLDDMGDPLPSRAVTHEIDSHHREAGRIVLAVAPVEEEVDRRQHIFGRECLDDFPRWWFGFLGLAATLGREPTASDERADFAADIGVISHLTAVMIDDEPQLSVVEVPECQGDSALGVDDQLDGPMGSTDPVGNLLRIGDRRRQADQLDVLGAEDDRFLPCRTALWVSEVVNFVEDHALDAVEFPRRLEQHVAQDFGRHHHDRGVWVLGDVSGQETDVVPVDRSQVAELLIAERLDRRRVHDTRAAPERLVDAELSDDCLSGSRGSSDHDRFPLQEGEHRLQLEGIELERIEHGKLLDALG